MIKESKNKKVIIKGEKELEELKSLYTEGLAVEYYEKLFNEYKRLSKRYEKVIKISDGMSGEIINLNKKLDENLKYTLTRAKEKLHENIKEHQKTKKQVEFYKTKLQNVDDLKEEKKKKSNDTITQINHQFEVPLPTINNEVIFENLEQSLLKKTTALDLVKTVIKIELLEVEVRFEQLEKISLTKSFLKTIKKYLQNNFFKNDQFICTKFCTFYILKKDALELDLVKLNALLNNKRTIFNMDIKFKFSINEIKEKQELKEIVTSCLVM